MSKTILITGGAGFVGSSLALLLKAKYPHYSIICLDNLKRRGSELNLVRLKEADINFVHGDIRNKSDINSVGEIDVLIDAAAEPSVLAGLDGGMDYLIDTNFNGTINSLEYAKSNSADFIFLSTSRVYPIEQLSRIDYLNGKSRFDIVEHQTLAGVTKEGISENFPLVGSRSLYGSSKLASELFVTEYESFFDLKGVINRCGVLTGPYQMGKIDQGVIVLWAARHFWKGDLAYNGFGGEGKQVRDILHVADLFDLVDWQIHNMSQVSGRTFNVGGGHDISFSLKELTEMCVEISGNTIPISQSKQDRKGDIPIYITDNAEVTRVTGWKPKIGKRQILNEIFDWIAKNEEILRPILK
jgi:CDP-paratose 2-epimerase